MSATLDKITSYYVKNVGFDDSQSLDDRDLILEAAEKQIKETIIEEIKKEAKLQIIRDAEKEIKRAKNEKKLHELKEIIWSGFLIAFVVGLLVNQITEIIGYFKGTQTSIKSTYWISLALFIICIFMFIIMFINRIIDIYHQIKGEDL